jgi:hypothetical protein
MKTVAEYFAENRYKPKYFLGDRVTGKWNKIPFVGTVANDSVVSDTEGPKISIFLDLPIKYKNNIHTIIVAKHRDVKYFK